MGYSGPLAQVMSLDEYRAQRQRHFPSAGALEWYCRVNKPALVDAGALLKLRGQWHVHAERFDQAVLDIAQASSKLAAA